MYVLLIIVCRFVLFLFAIVLSVLLRYMDYDCPFDIFKLFINPLYCNYLLKQFVSTFVCKFQISGSPKEFLHNESGVDKHDECFVQTFEVDTKNMAKFDHVFVSVWSVNQVRNI